MTEFQFQIEDLRWWAPEGVEILHWPDRVPILDHGAPTEHRAFLTGHTYVYTLPHKLEVTLKCGRGEILPHFEGLSGDVDANDVEANDAQRHRLTYLYFREFIPTDG